MITELLEGLNAFFLRGAWSVLRDLVDIGVVAFLLYRVLALLRGTRAMQMGMGLALVLVIYQVARRTGLVTTWTILDSLLTYIVLLIIVVFQNDIRRALMRVGTRPLFRPAKTARDTHAIEEVVKAAGLLAQKRIGALVVFERDAMLDGFIEAGTVIDADVTKELLYSLFIPSFENPMHDGAVIIRDGRVWQAGAFLPLAGNPKLDKTLGARHRAALGISEETDAVVVVVSEERGAVNLCFHGNLVRNLDSASLKETLHGLFYGRPRTRRTGSDAGARLSRPSGIPPAPVSMSGPVADAPSPRPSVVPPAEEVR